MIKNNLHITKVNKREKFWFHNIRSMNYFAYRYWWLLLLLFILYLILWYLFCFRIPYQQDCINDKNFNQTVESIKAKIDSCCDCNDKPKVKPPLYVPRENCRVHFSGLLMGGRFIDNYVSKIYEVDRYSEYVGEGDYPDNSKAFPKSVYNTFDGIAIDSGTRLIIYSGKNFSGKVLLDVEGPKIINNVFRKNLSIALQVHDEKYPSYLENKYPKSVREWSISNMIDWNSGSCKIICAQ
jgi:hypothetical protein